MSFVSHLIQLFRFMSFVLHLITLLYQNQHRGFMSKKYESRFVCGVSKRPPVGATVLCYRLSLQLYYTLGIVASGDRTGW